MQPWHDKLIFIARMTINTSVRAPFCSHKERVLQPIPSRI